MMFSWLPAFRKLSEWMAQSGLPLHWIRLRHRCQVALSLGKPQSAGHFRPRRLGCGSPERQQFSTG